MPKVPAGPTHPLFTVCAVLLILFATAGVFLGHDAATLPGDADVVATGCNDDGDIGEVTLRVEFRGEQPVTATPHVWSSKHHIQYAWAPEDVRLEPGAQTVTITAPRRDAAPTTGELVQVSFAAGQERLITNFEAGECGSA